MRKAEPELFKIEIEKDGKLYTGSYKIEKGMISVFLNGLVKKTHVSKIPVRNFAKLLLSELVGEFLAKERKL